MCLLLVCLHSIVFYVLTWLWVERFQIANVQGVQGEVASVTLIVF